MQCQGPLLDDQRYCLQCGARRDRPRLDFSAFWRPAAGNADSTTGNPGGAGEIVRKGLEQRRAGRGFLGSLPSPRTTGALAAAVLGVGIAVGVALGPGPGNSLAKDAALTPQTLLALGASVDTTASATGDGESQTPSAPLKEMSHPKGSSTPKSAPPTSEPSGSSESDSSESSTSQESGSTPSKEAKSESSNPVGPIKPPPVKHVWVIALAQESIDAALSKPTSQPYLVKQLLPRGTLLRNYELTASSELANEIAMLSGQGVNSDTEQNCPTYGELLPPTINSANGLTEGVGCVYPKQVQTLTDELADAGLSWRAYVRGLQPPPVPATIPQPVTPAVTCRHPQLGEADPNHVPSAVDPYATYSNPFVYFDSLLESGACASDDVDLGRLTGDLASSTVPASLSWISPGACVAPATASPCVGATQATETDSFLKQTVPEILASSAYKQAGLIAIVPVSAPTSTASGSSPGASEGPLGALLLSPFVNSKATVSESFNDFSLSKSLARLYGVLPLGHASSSAVESFGAGVYRTTEKAAQAASPAGG